MVGNAERFHPGRVIMGSFATAIALGSLLLALPAATQSGVGAGVGEAVFTATSAVSVTGLAIVDAAT